MLFVAIPHQIDADFGTFWAAYPKKVGKFDARRAWGKVYRSTSLTQILTALQWQRTSKQWKAGYVPNPATYLNQGRFLDEPQEDLSAQPVSDLAPCPRCGSLEGLCRDIKTCNARWLAQQRKDRPAPAGTV